MAFSCRRGETTAVIGGTGSGKSTIGRLMMRFYDVNQGTVRICGRDVREMRQQDLRERVSYVPQKAWLFSGTIADNLKYGKPDASEEEMLHTLSAAQADFVTELQRAFSLTLPREEPIFLEDRSSAQPLPNSDEEGGSLHF